mgnify:CR=1 FL=1
MSKRSKHSHCKSRPNKNKQGSASPTSSTTASQSQSRRRIAVFGGDGRPHPYAESQGDVRYFQSPGNGGNGGVKQLEASLRAGGIDLVLVLTRWNGHSATKSIRRLCSQLGVPIQSLK